MYDDGNLNYRKIQTKYVTVVTIDCSNKTPEQVLGKLQEEFKYKDVKDKLVLMRLKGRLKLGKLIDINLKELTKKLYENGAYHVMKNTTALTSQEFEEIKKSFNVESAEEEVIKEHLGQIKIEGLSQEAEKELITDLIALLAKEKQEGETNPVYEERINSEVKKLLE